MNSILILEKDKEVRKGRVDFLKESGFEVSFTEDQHLFEKLTEINPDILLLDKESVSGNVVDLVIKIQEEGADTSIILTGNKPDSEQLISILKYGAFDYLVKPLDLSRLEESVNGAIENRKSFKYIVDLSANMKAANIELRKQQKMLQADKCELEKKMQQRTIIYDISKVTNSSTKLGAGLLECSDIIVDYLELTGVQILLFNSSKNHIDYQNGTLYGCIEVDKGQSVEVEIQSDIFIGLQKNNLIPEGSIESWLSKSSTFGNRDSGDQAILLSLEVDGNLIGKLFLYTKNRESFISNHGDGSQFLLILAKQVSTLISRISLIIDISTERDRLQKWNNDLNLFNEISRSIVSSLDSEHIVSEFAQRLGEMISYDMISLLLFESKHSWVFADAAYDEYKLSLFDDTIEKFGNRLAKGVCLTGPSAYPLEIKNISLTGKEIHVPLEVAGMRVGIIRLLRFYDQSFDEYQARLLSMISSPLALGLRNAEAHRQVQEMALRDGLTNLLNKRSFEVEIFEQFEKVKSEKDPLSMLMIDVDHFKNINDKFGHQVGDDVLKEVARLLMAGIRDGDVASRYGGEEFALILPGVDNDLAFKIADRLRARIAKQTFRSKNTTMNLTISIGIVSVPDDAISKVDQLVEVADRALYKAKNNGRNRVEHGCSTLLNEKKNRIAVGN